jgi:hypothetical protein
MNNMSRQLYRRLSRYTKTPSNANKITSIFSPPYIGSLVIQLQIICRVRVGVSSNDIHPPVVDTTPMRYGHKLNTRTILHYHISFNVYEPFWFLVIH